MSAKARSLLKKLRAKKTEEEGGNTATQNIEENKKDDLQLPPVKISKNSHSVPKEIIKKVEEPFIDPLDYFKTEHIIIKESTMEEYGAANIRKEIEKEEKKEKEAEGSKKIGGMIGRGFKINFDEMMKARSKVKKEALPEKKSMSVGTRNLKNQNASKFEYVRKNRRNKEDNLYIKLILAKNKFNLGNSQQLYLEILRRIDELKGYNLPDNLKKELNDIINDLKLPKNLVLCEDVQVVSDDEDGTDPIGKKISLDQVINKMNIRGDM